MELVGDRVGSYSPSKSGVVEDPGHDVGDCQDKTIVVEHWATLLVES